MASITIKNIPESLHRRLKLQAQQNRRSLCQEILHELQRAGEPDRAQLLAEIDAERDGLARHGLRTTADEIEALIQAGRR
ncbi:MAG: FitA-like ribbon-helix-helix domain-containing protein [Terriglobales bacterium]